MGCSVMVFQKLRLELRFWKTCHGDKVDGFSLLLLKQPKASLGATLLVVSKTTRVPWCSNEKTYGFFSPPFLLRFATLKKKEWKNRSWKSVCASKTSAHTCVRIKNKCTRETKTSKPSQNDLARNKTEPNAQPHHQKVSTCSAASSKKCVIRII